MKTTCKTKKNRHMTGKNGQPVKAIVPRASIVRRESKRARASTRRLRRELKKISPSARLLTDVADEREQEAAHSFSAHKPPNDEASWRAHPFEIAMNVPGLLAGMAFDEDGILRFLAETIHQLEARIDTAIRRYIAARRAPRGISRSAALNSLLLWHETALLSHEIYTENPAFCAGLGQFNSPFEGIAKNHIFSAAALIDLFCEFLNEHRAALSLLIIEENQAGRPSLELAEALVIAEQVLHRNGVATDLDSADPTPAQLQMWETRLAAIAARHSPSALAA
jgi:hypothetical protein